LDRWIKGGYMNILVAVVTTLILVHLAVWLMKKLLRGIISVFRRGVSIVKDNEEEIKETYKKSKEALHRAKEAAKDSLPAREELTTGRKTAIKVIALLVVGMLVGAFSFGAIAVSILSNFNFAAGMY
jgi:hypothetical protein